MNSVLIKVLEGLTLAIPIAGAAVIRFFPFSRPLPGRFFSLLFLIPVGADLLSIGLFRVQPDPARFLAQNFALVIHLAVLLPCFIRTNPNPHAASVSDGSDKSAFWKRLPAAVRRFFFKRVKPR